MSRNCFISFKKEDARYKDMIADRLGANRISGKALDRWIKSDDIDYVMQTIRNDYMWHTSVTIFLIGSHSSEKEGVDMFNQDRNAFIKRELQATLYDGKDFRRSGLLGIVLPEMEEKIYRGSFFCNKCGKTHNRVAINDETVIREFSANYYLDKCHDCCYTEEGRFCVLAKYEDFLNKPDFYIERAYKKLDEPICQKVHWKDLR